MPKSIHLLLPRGQSSNRIPALGTKNLFPFFPAGFSAIGAKRPLHRAAIRAFQNMPVFPGPIRPVGALNVFFFREAIAVRIKFLVLHPPHAAELG